MPKTSPTVLVVGAGPTGLLLTAELVRRQVDCQLIDAYDAPLGWDRATVVHERSIEVFEALGLVDRLLERAVKVRGARLRSDARTLGEIDLALAGTRYGFDLGLSEDVVESVLTEYLEGLGGVVIRSTRLIGIQADVDSVVATVEKGGNRQDIHASWIVGCDGFHSTTRRLAGIDFPGTDLDVPWAVFDAAIENWDEEFDMNFAHFDIPPVILCPLPGSRWRVYVRPTSVNSDLVADATTTLHRYEPAATFVTVDNPRRFHCHSRVATQFRSGSVLLAGDAAHACSPSEGHGMNTGLQDAFNLGWKLALASQGINGPALLESYEAERRPVALRIVASGEVFEGNQAMRTVGDRAERDVVIRRTFADRETAHHEAVAAAELDRSYEQSSLVRGDRNDHLAPGDLLPDTPPVRTGSGEVCALHELTHLQGHTVLVIGGRGAEWEEVLDCTLRIEEAIIDSPLISSVIGLCVQPANQSNRADQRIGRIHRDIAERLGIEELTILAVRPDRYVGFRHDGADVVSIGNYLDAFSN